MSEYLYPIRTCSCRSAVLAKPPRKDTEIGGMGDDIAETTAAFTTGLGNALLAKTKRGERKAKRKT